MRWGHSLSCRSDSFAAVCIHFHLESYFHVFFLRNLSQNFFTSVLCSAVKGESVRSSARTAGNRHCHWWVEQGLLFWMQCFYLRGVFHGKLGAGFWKYASSLPLAVLSVCETGMFVFDKIIGMWLASSFTDVFDLHSVFICNLVPKSNGRWGCVLKLWHLVWNDDVKISSCMWKGMASHARESRFLKLVCKRIPYPTAGYDQDINCMVLLCMGFTSFQHILKIWILSW